jgi:hypothetical protein
MEKRMKRFFVSLILLLNGCSISNQLIIPSDNQIVNSSNNVSKSGPVPDLNLKGATLLPLEIQLSEKAAKLFDRNGDGLISAEEFKVNASIWIQNKVIENYENWDHIKKIPLKPVPVSAVTRALSAKTGDGYFYFGTVSEDNDVDGDDYKRISEGLAGLLLKDSISENGKIPVGTFKTGFSGNTVTLTENISENSLRRALVRQFNYAPDTFIELSNKLHPNNDSDDKVLHRIARIDHEYIGWL